MHECPNIFEWEQQRFKKDNETEEEGKKRRMNMEMILRERKNRSPDGLTVLFVTSSRPVVVTSVFLVFLPYKNVPVVHCAVRRAASIVKALVQSR